MTRKFLESLDHEGGDVVPKGSYTIEVIEARALEDKPFAWLDLKILGGPDQDRVVSVGLNMPSDGDSRGAIWHFNQKLRGFAPELAKARVFELPDDEQPEAICEAILGAVVDAELSVQEGGEYDGSQQLDSTSQSLDGVKAEPEPAPPETVPEAEPEPSKPKAEPRAKAENVTDATAEEPPLPF